MTQAMQASNHRQDLILGSGCFWGAEKYYQSLDGVLDAVSGYADGSGVEPNYQAISKAENRSNPNNFAEVVKVSFDANQITAEQLLKGFFENHDPTQHNRQGNDIGTQYRSIILTTNAEQQQIAERLKSSYQVKLTDAGYGSIQTIIKPLQKFYPAEEYHQNYLQKNPNGYCPIHATGVKFDDAEKSAKTDNSALQKGKHIVVLMAKTHCPYCQKLKAEVLADYRGDIALHQRFADQLQGLKLTTPTWATPTIFFLEDGSEVFANQGYMNSTEFYRALGQFKLGDSEAFAVAFNQGTDNRFCRQYDLFKSTPPGVFIDKLSGAELFDTEHRFNSGSGWLSFTQAIADQVIERPDNSHGMQRTEVLSKSSGIHLGHVFNDGPNGQKRYCINATVLDFKPRD